MYFVWKPPLFLRQRNTLCGPSTDWLLPHLPFPSFTSATTSSPSTSTSFSSTTACSSLASFSSATTSPSSSTYFSSITTTSPFFSMSTSTFHSSSSSCLYYSFCSFSPPLTPSLVLVLIEFLLITILSPASRHIIINFYLCIFMNHVELLLWTVNVLISSAKTFQNLLPIHLLLPNTARILITLLIKK